MKRVTITVQTDGAVEQRHFDVENGWEIALEHHTGTHAVPNPMSPHNEELTGEQLFTVKCYRKEHPLAPGRQDKQ